MTGSAIATTGDVVMTAGEHIRLRASENRLTESSEEHVKKRGFTNGGGIGIGYSKQESRTTFDGERTTQSQSGSVVGTSAGNLVMTAGKDIHVSGSDLIAGRAADDMTKLNGHIDLQAQNITIDPAQDHANTQETRSSKQSGIGVALVGTPLDTVRNLRDIRNSGDKGYAKSRNTINELAHSGATTPGVSVSYSKSSSNSQRGTVSQNATNSSVTAAGDIRMRATGNGQLDANGKPIDGNITLTGATLTAGGLAMLDAERDVTLQAATSHYQENTSASSKNTTISYAPVSLGDMGRSMSGGPNNSGVSQSIYNSHRSKSSGNLSEATQTPSAIIADRVLINSRTGNIRVAGSAIVAERDVGLIAREGSIDIVAGTDTSSEHRATSSKTIGDLGSNGKGNGTSSTVGVRKESSAFDRNSATQGNIRSTIISNKGDVTLDAKNELTLRGADVAAGRNLIMVGKEVILDPGSDAHQLAESRKMSQFGSTLAMGGMAVDAAKAADQAMEAHSRGDKRLATLYGAKAALIGYNASQGTHSPTPNSPVNSGGSLIKFTSSIGGGSQRSTQSQDGRTHAGTTLQAGDTIAIVATGSGALDAEGYAADGSIRARGAQITAKNVQMIAARDIDLVSAQDTTAQQRSSKGSNASVGVGFALGGQQNGFTIELAAGQNKGNGTGNSVTHQNTVVTASDTFTYASGRDTNLKGAQVVAQTIRGTANRNLNIESQQDTDQYTSRDTSSGAQVSICVPPICYGTAVTASVQDSRSNIESSYTSVNQQSGFYAGSGGYQIETKGNTNLKGGVIASTAQAAKNNLITGTLTTSDIENRASYRASTSNIAVSVSSGSSAMQNAANNATSMAVANLQKPMEETVLGTTKSAISPGTITITDDKAQQALTSKTAHETIASLNRDTDNAHQKVTPVFDLQKIERKQEINRVMADVAQQAAPILYEKVGDVLHEQPEPIKVAVHGLIGGFMSKALGGEFGSGALGVAAATAAVAALEGQFNDLGLTESDRNALLQSIGTAVGYVASGGSASTALTAALADQFNRQLHSRERMWAKENAQDFAKYYEEATGQRISAADAERKLLAAGYRIVDAAASRGLGGDIVAGAYISQNAGNLFSATPTDYNNPQLNGNANGTLTPEQGALPGAVANPAAGLGVAAGLISGGIAPAVAPRLLVLGESAVQLSVDAWTAYRAATAAYSMGTAFGTGAVVGGTTYTGGAIIGSFYDAQTSGSLEGRFNQRFSYPALGASMLGGGISGVYGTAMFNWAGVPNALSNLRTIPGAVIRLNSVAAGTATGRAAQAAVDQSRNNN